MTEFFISIVIPSKNSEKTIEQVLVSVFNQTIGNFEVIVVDSGSKDNTLNILKKFSIKLNKIQPHEFGHGKTRNLGAELACGDILVFLNSDAIPLDKQWLKQLIKPLNDSQIAATFSRLIPYSDCNSAERFFILKTYPPFSKTLSSETLKNDLISGFISFSSISGGIKKSIWKELKFREDIPCEDNDFGQRILRSGLKTRYCAESKVMHSHNYKMISLFKRYFEVGLSHREVVNLLPRSPFLTPESIRYNCSLLNETFKYAVIKGGISAAFYSLLYNVTKASGYLAGFSARNMPNNIKDFLSYTASLRKS